MAAPSSELNVVSLCNALQSSFSPNKVERDQAEDALKSINGLPNACPLLLVVINNRTEVPEPIRSAAVIYLKNILRVSTIMREGMCIWLYMASLYHCY